MTNANEVFRRLQPIMINVLQQNNVAETKKSPLVELERYLNECTSLPSELCSYILYPLFKNFTNDEKCYTIITRLLKVSSVPSEFNIMIVYASLNFNEFTDERILNRLPIWDEMLLKIDQLEAQAKIILHLQCVG